MTTDTNFSDLKTAKTKVRSLADLLEAELKQGLHKAWLAEQDVLHLDALEDALYVVTARIMDIGDCAMNAIQKESKELAFFKINYEWSDTAKSFLVLCRNVIFEEQKALLNVSEGVTSMENYKLLKQNSKQVIEGAGSELISELNKSLTIKGDYITEVNKISLRANPWPTYKQQIASIPTQAEALVKQFKNLWNASGLYVLVKSNIQDDFANQRNYTDQFKAAVNQIASSLEFAEELDMSEVVKDLNALNEEFLSNRSFQDMQKDLGNDLKGLPKKEKYVINAAQKLSYEEMDLKSRTVAWLDSEILPLLNNFYAIRANIKNQFNLSLSNIKNRMVAEREQGVAFEKADLLNALNTFIKRVEKSEQQISNIKDEVEQNLNDFAIHKIYNGNFLILSIASTLNQYNQTGKQRFEGVKNWITKKGIFVKQFQDSVEEEERLSQSEKLVRVINAREPRTGSSHYTNMFKTRGYIGASFMVGRKSELQHVKSIIDNWQLGYRGAIMITGTRFSGKTLLAEVISQRHFTDKTIKLQAGKKLQVGGRHIDPTGSLKEQLDFVIKYSLQEKVLVLIDNLYQWHDEDHSLLENVRALAKIIDRYSNKLFFMVCLNNWQKERFNAALNLDSIFQAEINTDTVTLDELNQAVLIRHSATHTELVDENGEETNNKSIYNKLKNIYNATQGNIGSSLLRWAQDIEMYDEDKVRYTYQDYTVPHFLTPSNSILIKTILMYGSTNEYNLRRLFGPAFQTEYKPLLQRLINVGVITRNINGKLEVRKTIINDIAALLAENTNFTYLKKSNSQ